MSEVDRYVFDTSAILTLRGDEPGADRVENLLGMAARGHTQILLSFMTRMELLYRIGRDEGAEVAAAAIRLLDATAIRWISCDDDVLEEASREAASPSPTHGSRRSPHFAARCSCTRTPSSFA